MSELITSVYTRLNFPKYVNQIIDDFKPEKCNIINRNYEPRECRLYFPISTFWCEYSLEFENEKFFLKINFEIDDDKYPDFRKQFCEKLNFLIIDKCYYSQNNKSIILKSNIDEKLIERAQIIFATERWMKSYFFPETRIAIEEMVALVFDEFKEIMHQIWKTIFENFETMKPLDCFVESTICSQNYLTEDFDDNPYNLPPIIKIYFDSYQKQKLEQLKMPQIINVEKKNWIKRIYTIIKKTIK